MTPFVFVLAMVLFMHADSPVAQVKVYYNQFDCEVEEGRVLTEANKDPTVDGWVFVGEPCSLVLTAKKS